MFKSQARIAFLVVLVGGGAASAGVQKITLHPNESLHLSYSRANVTVGSTKEPQVTVATGASCHEWQVETRENEIRWRDPLLMKSKNDGAVCAIQVLIPSGNLQIHLLEGSISVAKTQADLLLHVQKGKVAVRESGGSAVIHVQKGEVQVQDYQGRLRLDLQQAPSQVRNLNGDLELQALAGEHLIEKAKGNLRLLQAQGSAKVVGGGGSLQLETQKSSLTTQGFAGRIEGQTQEGAVQLQLTGEPDVNLRSQSGRVSLAVPAGAGPSVNLFVQDGELVAPSYLTVSRDGAAKTVRGRLRGEAGRGSVVVRAQEGTVVLK